MLITNPYSTSYGSLINTVNIQRDLDTYFIKNNIEGLSYEYNNPNNINLVYILGKNQEEKDITMWKHPILYRDIRNRIVLATDLRPYVKDIKDQDVLNIKDVVRDKAAVNFLVKTSNIMAYLESGDTSLVRKFYGQISVAYSALVSYMVNIIVALNPAEKVEVELMAMYFCNAMLTRGNLKEHKESIIARISMAKLITPYSRTAIKDLLENVNLTNGSVEGLVELIKLVLPKEKGELITEQLLLNILSNSWYGPGGTEAMVMAMECIPYFIGIITSAGAEMQYKKSRVNTIVDKYKRLVNTADIDKSITLEINNNTLAY